MALARKGETLYIKPANQNQGFALGQVSIQKVLRVGTYIGGFGQREISHDHPTMGWEATYEVLAELLGLGYPLKHVEIALAAIPASKATQVSDAGRTFVRRMRKRASRLQLTQPADVLLPWTGGPVSTGYPNFPLRAPRVP